MYVVLDNDNDNHISNQRNTEQESDDDDEVIEEIMQDGLSRASGTGPADPATAGPKVQKPTNSKNFSLLFIYTDSLY